MLSWLEILWAHPDDNIAFGYYPDNAITKVSLCGLGALQQKNRSTKSGFL